LRYNAKLGIPAEMGRTVTEGTKSAFDERIRCYPMGLKHK